MSETKHEIITNFTGAPIGFIDTLNSGMKVVKNSHNMIVGYYLPGPDLTVDKNNVVKFKGDYAYALLDKER